MKTILIVIFVLFLVPIFVNSSAICVNNPDEFIVKCTINEKYFIQDFTCLNKDCSYKIINKGEFQELTIPNSENAIILNNYIGLKDVYKDLAILNILCDEKFSENELKFLDKKSKEYFSNPIKSYSGNKHTIEPNFLDKVDELKNLKEKQDNLADECYTYNLEVFGTWIIKTNIRKDYCTIKYDAKNDCFQTNLVREKYSAYLITNPTTTYNYIFIYVLISLILINSILFIYKLKRDKKLITFLKPTKHKLMIKIILMIPTFYLVGIIINYISYKKYYFFMTIYLEILIIILALILIYFVSALIEYKFINKK